jgi:nitrogen fixation/metabolism regulation signal transduction histidine kinase
VVVSILAVSFFRSGVSIWFSKPVKDTLNDASVVAELYLQEHMRGIRTDAVFVANKIKHLIFEYDLFSDQDKAIFRNELDELIDQQSLDEAFLFVVDRASRRMTSVGTSLAFSLELSAANITNAEELDIAADGEVVVKENQGFMQALTCIDSDMQDISAYLWVGKGVDENILKYVTKARDSTKYYNELLAKQHQFQMILITLFALSSLLLLLASTWVGLFLASLLIDPIKKLIWAADSVSHGDLSVRIKDVPIKNELGHLVKSFNRMTEQLEKQNRDLIISEKKSTWSDIARKIAHEVKNPLTPIQLSAERLKRKYSNDITKDPETFVKCIDTITRQVSHIENLINEFSAFARMPEAEIKPVDFSQLIRDAVFMQKQAFKNIKFQIDISQKQIMWPCDSQQMFQVFTNILQNAANAITESQSIEHGKISVSIGIYTPSQKVLEFVEPGKSVGENEEKNCVIIVEDNGPGFPSEERERLFEPYYTTRKNGTGLGMAIVLRIVTEHFGTMELKDAIGHGGARVEIKLPYIEPFNGEPFNSEPFDGGHPIT